MEDDARIQRTATRAINEIQKHLTQSQSTTTARQFAPPLATLLSIYPPSAYPLLELIERVKTALVDDGTQQTAHHRASIIQLLLLYVAGCKAGGAAKTATTTAIYDDGHPKRAVVLFELAQWLLVEIDGDGGGGNPAAGNPFVPAILDGIAPRIPTSALTRAQWSLAMLQEAESVAKRAFGRDDGGGILGERIREVIAEVRGWLGAQRG